MKDLKNYIIFFFFITVSCGKQDSNPKTQEQGGKSVNINFPEATFTEPNKSLRREASPIIMNRLISLVDASEEGSTIHISIFGCDYPTFTSSLKNAAKRNVQVFLMLDMSDDDTYKENQRIVNELKNTEGVEIVIVTNDAGDIAINHNKFALFSKVKTTKGDASNIIFQTSHNFTLADSKKIQDAVTLKDEGLYNAFLTYWMDMRDRAKTGMKDFEYREYIDETAGVYAYFLPKRKDNVFYGDDTIIEILNGISLPSSATIRVGMSGWTDTRLNIAEYLEVLLDQGAKIQVITKPGLGPLVEKKLREMQTKGADVKIYSESKVNIHSKFMLIDGYWRGKNSSIVVNGSQNFTRNALRYNNEVTLVLSNPQLYKKYDEFYKEIMKFPE